MTSCKLTNNLLFMTCFLCIHLTSILQFSAVGLFGRQFISQFVSFSFSFPEICLVTFFNIGKIISILLTVNMPNEWWHEIKVSKDVIRTYFLSK